MCGIAGIVSKRNTTNRIDEQLLNKMSSLISHRGPDDNGIKVDEKNRFGLVHRRLSIVDLTSRGHQPMTSKNGNWIVYNGELYNFKDVANKLSLDKELSKSDTSVILEAYNQWGENCVKYTA